MKNKATKNKSNPFELNGKDRKALLLVAQRAAEMPFFYRRKETTLTIYCQLLLCHVKGARLRIFSLLRAPDRLLERDVRGIRENLNPRTGKLMNSFVPRFAH